ncbi:MAG: hypothetical protein K8F52_10050 [Candidatus Scalindua rubra]|uniref:Uncharacterized protein n=1 Tax=Candidatus Scalindua brodae TaxID=237368 RepID=A0A0B0EMW1_9BACT|nr:MAG: hypothetical protein SCABRO_00293 [Candidatus Scalindua brodae]MBZ0109000.1 hypothetical protein [Candidatus Scalindua rubra]
MIRASFKLRMEDLDSDLIEKLKNMFDKKNVIEINVSDEIKETDFLLSTPANRESLYRSLKQLKEGDIVSKSIKEIES